MIQPVKDDVEKYIENRKRTDKAFMKQLDSGYLKFKLTLRKRVALTPAKARGLILSGRDLPKAKAKDEAAVQDAIDTVRRRRGSQK